MRQAGTWCACLSNCVTFGGRVGARTLDLTDVNSEDGFWGEEHTVRQNAWPCGVWWGGMGRRGWFEGPDANLWVGGLSRANVGVIGLYCVAGGVFLLFAC